MASISAAIGEEVCDICFEVLTNQRVLDCDHVFCLNCLEKLECCKKIECPFCKCITRIPLGMQVKHLSKVVRGKTREKQALKMIKCWKVKEQITSIAVDDDKKLVYAGQWPSASVLVYSFNGRLLDTISGSDLHRPPRITFDTKRDLLVRGSGVSLRSYNEIGTRIDSADKIVLNDINCIAYQVDKDRYVIGDHITHNIHFYVPAIGKVVRSIPAEEARTVARGGGRNVLVSTPKTSDYSLIATADSEKSLVKLYDGAGNFTRSYGGVGSGFGKMNRIDGICFDFEGRILVSDRENQRIIRISPDAVDERKEWEVVMNTEKLGVGHLRAIDVTSDGFIVMSSFTDPSNGPFYLTILGGYQ